jgi:hypothetical protein
MSVESGVMYMSTIVENLQENLCSGVFFDIFFLLGVFVEMNISSGVLGWLSCLMGDIYDFIPKKFPTTSNLRQHVVGGIYNEKGT